MIVKLLTEQHLEFLSLKRGCTGSSESTLVKCHIVGELIPRTILCHFNSFSRRKVNKYFFTKNWASTRENLSSGVCE